MSARPSLHRYEEIAMEIRACIQQGVYTSKGRLPAERILAKTFATQRNTVRQALGLLESEGHIRSARNSGWYISGSSVPAIKGKTPVRRVMLVTFRKPTGATIDGIAIGLRDVLEAANVPMLRFDSSGLEESSHIKAIEELTTVDAGGIIMWPHNIVDYNLLKSLQSSAPLILVDRRVIGFESDSVTFDDREAGRTVTHHLLQQGHRRIAFLGDEPYVESVQNRWFGYRHALEENGITPDDRLTILTYGRNEPNFNKFVMTGLIEVPNRPTAVVCSNDTVASALWLLLRDHGLRVPQDIAITGFGNASSGHLDVMGLTTMSQPFEELGRIAGRLLLDRMFGPVQSDSRHTNIRLPMELVVRNSSGPHEPLESK